MTPLVRRFIKTALGFLLLGLVLGVYLLVRRELFGDWPPQYAISAHTHAVFVGFVMFMILGVALWIFPKPLAEDRRYRLQLIELVYWLLLAGTLMRFGGELARAYSSEPWLAWPVLLGGLAQTLALALYVWTMWYRIRASARQLREARGVTDR
jgi:heme/copper-type cytochrome/quinol oxidase subunit 1